MMTLFLSYVSDNFVKCLSGHQLLYKTLWKKLCEDTDCTNKMTAHQYFIEYDIGDSQKILFYH